ncbi:hypothetical protein HGRIS_007790 [Hohenbuehelia grisea]|uniref:BZIP domain-containing protein n=1 Tax=Hohenbuehelia grisea TaxID=104357 RepID=A0ABR3J5X8_9AGAR
MASSSPTVAASTTLWATPSKEWVIQPKPKPGRKPKKDSVPVPKDDDDAEGKGRRVQNRAAQRAFRERKQSQLAELQARVLSYEQGEIERNVALQNIAKRLKEENEKLRAENQLLKEKLAILENESEYGRDNDKKRGRDLSPAESSTGQSTRKRTRRASETPFAAPPAFPASYITSIPSPPSMASSPDSNGTCDTRFSPQPLESHISDTPHDGVILSAFFDYATNAKSTAINKFEPGVFPSFDCGLCTDSTPCVCRELAMQQVASAGNLKMEAFDQTPIITSMEQTIQLDPAPAPVQPSILDSLPAYQPPVPLRRRQMNSAPNAIFPVVSAAQPVQQSTIPTCSGDPKNCMACAGDLFGKTFCAEVEKTVAAMPQCSECPCSSSDAPGGCCGDPANCGNGGQQSQSQAGPSSAPTANASGETIPTSEAWRQFKSHPNVEFSDLAMLAEVVARRSKCTGPNVVISPAPGSITPERTSSPQMPNTNYGESSDRQPVLLTDPHAHYREKERERSRGPSPPRLVPQEVLLHCGRQRVLREVPTEAVEHALRLLDAKYARS